jgi:hypothetical protein
VLKNGTPFDVHPQVVSTVDFLYCGADDNKLYVPESGWPFAMSDTFAETGSYHFTITINAGGISDSITVAVAWPGRWNQIIAREVP